MGAHKVVVIIIAVIISISPQSVPGRWFTFYSGGNQHAERFNILSEVKQAVNAGSCI